MAAACVALLVSAVALSPNARGQVATDAIDGPALAKILTDLKMEPKNIAEEGEKPLFAFDIKTEKFNVPMVAEVSSSGRYIWLTCTLKEDARTSDSMSILRAIGDIQPTHLWVTKSNRLKMGLSIDNRGVNATVVKFVLDKLADDLEKTSSIWAR
ncbi:MAG: hypothetical protein JST35_06390 [Armatimonadetes bacterium]|nr:hypothetical protein [Armatimonadota bacterium]